MRGHDDILQLVEFVSVASHVFGIETRHDIQEAVRDCLVFFLEHEYAVVGDMNLTAEGPPIVPWVGSPESIVNEVIEKWDHLGDYPNLGDVCWVELTPAGREFAQSLDDV